MVGVGAAAITARLETGAGSPPLRQVVEGPQTRPDARGVRRAECGRLRARAAHHGRGQLIGLQAQQQIHHRRAAVDA